MLGVSNHEGLVSAIYIAVMHDSLSLAKAHVPDCCSRCAESSTLLSLLSA